MRVGKRKPIADVATKRNCVLEGRKRSHRYCIGDAPEDWVSESLQVVDDRMTDGWIKRLDGDIVR